MELTINPLVLATEAPPIPIAQAWRARYKGEYGPLIDLSQAVPGHPPPKSLLTRTAIIFVYQDTLPCSS